MDTPSPSPRPSAAPPRTLAGRLRGLAEDPVPLLALLLVLGALGQAVRFAGRWDAFDFYQFWRVGQAAAEAGTGDVWSQPERERLGREGLQAALREMGPGRERQPTRHALAASRREVLETYSTPWLYTLFGATATGDYERDLDRFQLVSVLAFALGLAAMARLAGLSWLAVALLSVAGLTWFAPLLSDARVGNVNRLQVGLLGLYLVLSPRGAQPPWRHLAAGAVLGLAGMFKPNLAFPVLALGLGWIVLGRWRKLALQAAGALAGALLAFALSSAWFGRAGAWSEWSAVLAELMDEYDHALAAGNFALARVLEDLGAALDTRVALGLGLLGLVGALVLRRRGGEPRDTSDVALEDLLLLGLGGALSLLAAKLAWLHYFVLVLPLTVVALRPEARRAVRLLGAVGLVLVALQPLRDAFGFEESSAVAARLVCGGTLLLYAVALYDLAAARRPGPA